MFGTLDARGLGNVSDDPASITGRGKHDQLIELIWSRGQAQRAVLSGRGGVLRNDVGEGPRDGKRLLGFGFSLRHRRKEANQNVENPDGQA